MEYYTMEIKNVRGNNKKKMLTEQHLRSILHLNTLIVKTI